ncbi:hypothetical protein GCM10018775_26770 [Streptomyces umbrinus]|nr:hypothetical protein GCM10018775_26770 [Streptomyces umbrinus]
MPPSLTPETEMVELTPWLLDGVGQVAALAGGAPTVVIMTDDRPSAVRVPVSARRRARGIAGEVMSLCLLPIVGVGQSFPAPAPLVTEATTEEAGSAL